MGDGDGMGAEEIVAAARAIRRYLNQLLGPTAAKAVDLQIGELLAHSSTNASVTDRLYGALTGSPATERWLKAFASYGIPPEIAEQREALGKQDASDQGEHLGYVYPGATAGAAAGADGSGADGSGSSGIEVLPGMPGVIAVSVYICPNGDYSWYELSIGQVPRCPYDGASLEFTGTR